MNQDLDVMLLSLLEEIVQTSPQFEGGTVAELIQALNSGELRFCLEHNHWESR